MGRDLSSRFGLVQSSEEVINHIMTVFSAKPLRVVQLLALEALQGENSQSCGRCELSRLSLA